MTVLAVLFGIVLGNRIRSARRHRYVDIGYRDGFATGRLSGLNGPRRGSALGGNTPHGHTGRPPPARARRP